MEVIVLIALSLLIIALFSSSSRRHEPTVRDSVYHEELSQAVSARPSLY